MNKNAFFWQSTNSRNEPRIKKLRDVHGVGGYGLYWSIVETIYENDCKCSIADIPKLLKLPNVTGAKHPPADLINSILFDFDLFEFDEASVWFKSNERIHLRASDYE